MNNHRFSKNARSIRLKALCFTLVIHFVILGSAFYGSSGGNAIDLLPEFVKEYFDDGEQQQPETEQEKKQRRKKKKKPQA